MIRVTVSVEGYTEEAFVKDVLYEHFLSRGIILTAINMEGNISLDRIIPELVRHYHGCNFLTTFYDFYGFKKNSLYLNGDDLEKEILERLTLTLKRNGHILSLHRFRPYIQMHEFEGLLFSNVEAFRLLYNVRDEHIDRLRVIRQGFNTPEDIINSKETSPSHRLEDLKIGYRKVEFGPILARKIGLNVIRTECQRFNHWIIWLENVVLGSSAP
jgi:hypothetical protein